jgi:hypothetical protein
MPHGKKPPSHSNKKKKKRSPMNAVSDTGVGETTNLPESVDASMPHRAVEHQQEVARRHEETKNFWTRIVAKKRLDSTFTARPFKPGDYVQAHVSSACYFVTSVDDDAMCDLIAEDGQFSHLPSQISLPSQDLKLLRAREERVTTRICDLADSEYPLHGLVWSRVLTLHHQKTVL